MPSYAKNQLRCSQQMPKSIMQKENHLMWGKIISQQPVGFIKSNLRAFGRNIANECPPQPKRKTRIKEEIKNELEKLKQIMKNPIQKDKRSISCNLTVRDFRPSSIDTEHNFELALTKDLIRLDTLTSKTQQNFIKPKEKPKDPQLCEEYTPEISIHLRSIEKRFTVQPNYMSLQPDINEKMRAILVDWLVSAHQQLKLLPETLFLTVNIIDRYLEKEHIMRQKLQLVGITAFLIACKYEEIYPPEIQDFRTLSENSFTKEEILRMEQAILKSLAFYLNVPTSFRFLQLFSRQIEASTKMNNLGMYFIELSFTEVGMLKYVPSTIAASALYLANKLLGKEELWNLEYSEKVKYNSLRLKPCVKEIITIVQQLNKSSLQAIKKKYSSKKYLEVALINMGKIN